MKQTWLSALSHLLAPRVCRICGQSLSATESVMCLGCDLDMPRLSLHKQPFNILHQRLGHHCVVDRAAGWFMYRRQSEYARLLVDAKYSNQPRLARQLGAKCAKELMADGFFDGIDMLVPMPMFWLKRLRRGYNQSQEICRGIADVTGIEVTDALKAFKSHGIQSRHNRQERYASISHTMRLVDSLAVAGMHVLIVDDIITSGASMIEAVRAVSAASPAAISILALGVTQLD